MGSFAPLSRRHGSRPPGAAGAAGAKASGARRRPETPAAPAMEPLPEGAAIASPAAVEDRGTARLDDLGAT